MKTLSIEKKGERTTFAGAGKWWDSKNMFFSDMAEEEFTNKEVVLAHSLLIAVLTCAVTVEVSFLLSFISLVIAGFLAVCLNKAESNDNINIKKNIL